MSSAMANNEAELEKAGRSRANWVAEIDQIATSVLNEFLRSRGLDEYVSDRVFSGTRKLSSAKVGTLLKGRARP